MMHEHTIRLDMIEFELGLEVEPVTADELVSLSRDPQVDHTGGSSNTNSTAKSSRSKFNKPVNLSPKIDKETESVERGQNLTSFAEWDINNVKQAEMGALISSRDEAQVKNIAELTEEQENVIDDQMTCEFEKLASQVVYNEFEENEDGFGSFDIDSYSNSASKDRKTSQTKSGMHFPLEHSEMESLRKTQIVGTHR